MGWSVVSAGWQPGPFFKYGYRSTMSKARDTPVCNICRSWCGLLWNLELFWNLQKCPVFSDCGFHFYCEPIVCMQSVMDCSLICCMAWCLDCDFPFPYLLCLTVFGGVFINKNVLCFSCSVCVLCPLQLLIVVLLVYAHCRCKREPTHCVKCRLPNVDVFKL
jgi:hypothetical protein